MQRHTPKGRRDHIYILDLIKVYKGSMLREISSAGDTWIPEDFITFTLWSGSWACVLEGGKLSMGNIWDLIDFKTKKLPELLYHKERQGPESARYSNVSSTYILIFSVIGPRLRPWISGFSQMDMASGSAARAYSSGDSGHPWRVPLERLNTVERPAIIHHFGCWSLIQKFDPFSESRSKAIPFLPSNSTDTPTPSNQTLWPYVMSLLCSLPHFHGVLVVWWIVFWGWKMCYGRA